MKITVQTSFPSRRPPASAFTPPTRFYPRTGFTVRGRDKNPSLRMQPSVRADARIPSFPSFPCERSLLSARMREFFIFYLYIFFGSCCRLGKREIYNLQFSVLNPQNPQNPQTPQASRASLAKPREEEGFFGLVPLVIHPSSIPLLGGLTPKFLSLSLHSF
jgi:hypothetical protein